MPSCGARLGPRAPAASGYHLHQLDAVQWYTCTRSQTLGHTDSILMDRGVPPPMSGPWSGVPAGAAGDGRQWTFAWDSPKDYAGTTDGFMLRAYPFDDRRNIGQTVYLRTVVRPGQ